MRKYVVSSTCHFRSRIRIKILRLFFSCFCNILDLVFIPFCIWTRRNTNDVVTLLRLINIWHYAFVVVKVSLHNILLMLVLFFLFYLLLILSEILYRSLIKWLFVCSIDHIFVHTKYVWMPLSIHILLWELTSKNNLGSAIINLNGVLGFWGFGV